MYQPLILQRLSKIVLPQITTEDNLIMINCTFHWGYVFFWVPLFWRTSKKHNESQLLFSPRPRSKISFERTATLSRSGEGRRCIFGLFGWTDDASSFGTSVDPRFGHWILCPAAARRYLTARWSVWVPKIEGAPRVYLGRVKKSCDARRKVRRCLKALVVGLNG